MLYMCGLDRNGKLYKIEETSIVDEITIHSPEIEATEYYLLLKADSLESAVEIFKNKYKGIIVMLYEKAYYSEGQASKILELDRIDFRILKEKILEEVKKIY